MQLNILKNNVTISFWDYGYTNVFVLEANHQRKVEGSGSQSDYYYLGDKLPIYHGADTSTFVLSGDGLSDTISFSKYNPKVVFNDPDNYNCGWTYDISEPVMIYSTLQGNFKRISFDETTNTLELNVEIP